MRSEVTSLKAQLDALKPAKPLVGLWPGDGKDYDRLLEAETRFGRPFDMYRERGVVGRLNTGLTKSGAIQIAGRGTKLSLNLACRTFVNGLVRPVPYTDVTAGRRDADLHLLAAEAKAIPGTGHIIELQSEANIDNGGAQPYSGTAAEFRAFFRYVVEFFRAEGVTNLRYVLTTTRTVFEGGQGGVDAWYRGLADVIDIVGVDGYSTPVKSFAGKMPGTRNSPEDIAGKAYDFAKSIGKPLAVCETGSQDDPSDPGYKPGWYAAWSDWLAAHPGVVAVVHNYSSDGIDVPYSQSWPFDSTTASEQAFKRAFA